MKEISWLELAEHCRLPKVWLAIEGSVYDVTTYLVQHPGGADVLCKHAGGDATKAFQSFHSHSDYAISLRDARVVGALQKNPPPASYQAKLEGLRPKKESLLEKEVAKHNSEQDCWVILRGKAVDVTDYLGQHPGGASNIMKFAGKDATQAFQMTGHSSTANKLAQLMEVKPERKRPQALLSRELKWGLLIVGVFLLIYLL